MAAKAKKPEMESIGIRLPTGPAAHVPGGENFEQVSHGQTDRQTDRQTDKRTERLQEARAESFFRGPG